MPARAAALCTRPLPSGKTCAQPALRGEPFCRFHNDARSRAIAEHDERMFALSDELDAMTIPQLLETVHDKLANIRSIVRHYGDAKLAVIVAVQRLAELSAEGFAIVKVPRRPPVPATPTPSPIKSTTPSQPAQNQRPPVSSSQLNDFAASLLKSMISQQGHS